MNDERTPTGPVPRSDGERSLFQFLRRWASGLVLGVPHDALTYVQGNLGLKPWSSRYGWWRR